VYIFISHVHFKVNKAHIVRYTEKELKELVEKEGDRSDWKRAASMTDAQIEAAVADDPDEAGMVMDWANATVELPQPKAKLNMRVDRDVLEYFRKTVIKLHAKPKTGGTTKSL
jgi:uncharacterized protein (DUF4415 family)